MKPSTRLIQIAIILSLLSLVLAFVRIALDSNLSIDPNLLFYSRMLWYGLLATMILAVLVDSGLFIHPRDVKVDREIVKNLSLGVKNEVSLTIINNAKVNLSGKITDMFPSEVSVLNLPTHIAVSASSHICIHYSLIPNQRGTVNFGQVCLLMNSRFKLWQKKIFLGKESEVKIYPNFAPIVRSTFIGLEQQLANLGVHNIQRRGQGLNFQQLREFRKGDSLRQIDWKATAKVRKVISKEYQDEKDQDVIFLLDCGRSMRSKDGDISHFDYALNAMLLTSYIALRQGDAVGFMSFAGEKRHLNPIKGKVAVNALLNRIYDLHSTTESSDFLEAAQALVKRYRKRSLIVLITNLKDEQIDEISSAVKLLKRFHIVMVASLRDPVLDNHEHLVINNFNNALLYAGTKNYLEERKPLITQLRANHVVFVDCKPQSLHTELATEYIRIKRAGLI